MRRGETISWRNNANIPNAAKLFVSPQLGALKLGALGLSLLYLALQ